MLLGWQAAVCGLPFDALQSPQWREGWRLCSRQTRAVSGDTGPQPLG